MTQLPLWSPLADVPAFPPQGYAELADRLGRILHTGHDILLIQAEAVVALEAVASSLGQKGLRALNIVTSMYGRWFGAWLRRQGAEVVDLTAIEGQPITTKAVQEALQQGRFDLVALVHAESAYGILNPLPQIAGLVKDHGALLVVDAVASVGGHALDVDALGIDVAVIGPQKSLGGQAGVSALSISPAAWARVVPAGDAPSVLSLADQRDLWLHTGRAGLPGTPSALEFHALQHTLTRVEAEGLPALQSRHAQAAAMAQAGALALTGRAWVAPEQASHLVTAVALPAGITADAVLRAAPLDHALSAGVGPAGQGLIRLNHTGPRARAAVVLADLLALARGLQNLGYPIDIAKALTRAAEAE